MSACSAPHQTEAQKLQSNGAGTPSGPAREDPRRFHSCGAARGQRRFLLDHLARTTCVAALPALMLAACGIAPAPAPTATFTPLPPPFPSLPATSEAAPEPFVWLTYTNPTYGYSLEYPGTLSLHAANDEYVQLGEKIEVAMWDIDPGAPLGDGPAIERVTDLQLAGRPARLFEGYIGSVGGYIPQRFKRYVVQTDDGYFLMTLYALGLGASGGSLSQIAELDPADIQLFDTITATVRWP